MANAYIEYPAVAEYKKHYCKPKFNPSRAGLYAECLVCDGVYRSFVNEVVIYRYPNEPRYVWERITRGNGWWEYRKAKRLAKKYAGRK